MNRIESYSKIIIPR